MSAHVRGLESVDSSLLCSDPYVVLKVGKTKQKTRIIKKDLNPFWNQKFSFKVATVQVLFTRDIPSPPWLMDVG